MNRFIFRIATLALAVALTALPLAAQVIPAGEDRWVTRDGGATFFTFPDGEVESLCGAPPSSGWDHTIELAGVPEPGYDWDTVVTRLGDADLSSGSASVPIQVTRMGFRSTEPHETPCGELRWTAKATDNQPITKMYIKSAADYVVGGTFYATIAARVTFEGVDSSGTVIGYLTYTVELPDRDGVPWSFGPGGTFRPGIDQNGDCVDVLREKLLGATGNHVYFIENLIAQGKCTREG